MKVDDPFAPEDIDTEEEKKEYELGYDDGYQSRGMKHQTDIYMEGYADGAEDRDNGAYYSPKDDIGDWCW